MTLLEGMKSAAPNTLQFQLCLRINSTAAVAVKRGGQAGRPIYIYIYQYISPLQKRVQSSKVLGPTFEEWSVYILLYSGMS